MYLISIIFIIFVIFSLRRKKTTEQWLSIESTNALRGLMAIGVFLSHLPLHVNHPIHYFSGSALVGMFFLLSGYGLAQACIKKKDYLNGFLNRRLGKIFYPYVAFILIWLIIENMIIKRITFYDFFIKFAKGQAGSNSWYVIAIMYFYICFWLCFKKSKFTEQSSISISLIKLFILTIIYIMVTWGILNWPDWWYKSSILFIFGVYIGFNKDKIYHLIKNNYITSLFFSFIFILFSWYSPAFYNIINRIIHIPLQSQYIWLINDFLMALSFPLLCIILDIHIHFSNFISRLLGKYSYELYLVHGEIIAILYLPPVSIQKYLNSEISTILCIIIVIITAVLLQRLFSYINSLSARHA